MYSFGMSARDIQHHLQQVYGVEVSPETISNITDAVMSDVREWQNRLLEKSYPILFLDALRVNSVIVKSKPPTNKLQHKIQSS